MPKHSPSTPTGRTRRFALRAAARIGGLGVVGLASWAYPRHPAGAADAVDEDVELVKRMLGGAPTPSSRVRLEMPPVFGNGYTVPLTLSVDSAMTEADYPRQVHVLAPRNPIILVATFRFTPSSGRAFVSTRIRLAEPQNVLAVAEMSDGTLLLAKTWVKVDTNGCA